MVNGPSFTVDVNRIGKWTRLTAVFEEKSQWTFVLRPCGQKCNFSFPLGLCGQNDEWTFINGP